MTAPPELLSPTSPAEAVAAFGDGAGVTVMGGGTILMPELTYGRLRPTRVLLTGRAGRARMLMVPGAVSPAAPDCSRPLATTRGSSRRCAAADRSTERGSSRRSR